MVSGHSKTMAREVQNDDHQCQHPDDGEENFNSERSFVASLPFYSTALLLFA
jgi:hypothetical protein